jgi:hypothetical protein
MDSIHEIAGLIYKIAINYPLGPVIVLASFYLIYDGYDKSRSLQIYLSLIALAWSLFTVYMAIVR